MILLNKYTFPSDKAVLKSQFVLFSKFGDKASDGETIKLSQSDKWFKQVKDYNNNAVFDGLDWMEWALGRTMLCLEHLWCYSLWLENKGTKYIKGKLAHNGKLS